MVEPTGADGPDMKYETKDGIRSTPVGLPCSEEGRLQEEQVGITSGLEWGVGSLSCLLDFKWRG